MQRISIAKALRVAAIVATAVAMIAAGVAFALESSLPYRIGPSVYTRYLWAERVLITAFVISLLGLALGIGSRQHLPTILAACCIIFLVVFMPASVHSGPNPKAWCYFDLRKIEAAKEQLRQQRNLTNGTAITAEEISPFIEGGIQNLKCYEGGVYTIGPIGTDPRCSIHGSLSKM